MKGAAIQSANQVVLENALLPFFVQNKDHQSVGAVLGELTDLKRKGRAKKQLKRGCKNGQKTAKEACCGVFLV